MQTKKITLMPKNRQFSNLLLSSKVADTLDYLREEAQVPQFLGSEATSAFCRQLDKGFDILNSRCLFAISNKEPVTAQNFYEKREHLLEFKGWLMSLKVWGSNGKDKKFVF